ncbi:hypothetical protein [Synechococcus sp. UW140]|uniref:hypothetical protein n=1 Tax=Synechococcus sp. UW140 TaxID=368503 RepID=UPI0025F4006E|nr:hypothetical protein [Synechococcus sp. UW140]
MTTSASQLSKSESTNNGAFGSSLPRWRLYLSMLNWRRDPGYEQRMMQRRKEIEQIKSEIERIKSETEQLKLENAKLRELNAKRKELLSSAALLCSPPEINLIPPNSTVQD